MNHFIELTKIIQLGTHKIQQSFFIKKMNFQ